MKVYKLNPNTNKIILVAIVVVIGISFMFYKKTGSINPILIPPLLVLIFRYFWQQNHKALILDEDHLEFSLSPIQAKRMVRYSDLKDTYFTEKGKKFVFTTKTSKTIKLPLKEFHKNDRRAIKEELLKATSQKA
ncbi:hypothetical protein [Maribacter thermophilus]|uniref:hypothetical protein n=1 Tax=Maribacter thermophilus TaxID=1197874 RepID=UPI000640DFFA|nr:hypothetical protein [Maribacter thermophilus]